MVTYSWVYFQARNQVCVGCQSQVQNAVISCGLISHLGDEICIDKVHHGVIEAHRVVRLDLDSFDIADCYP